MYHMYMVDWITSRQQKHIPVHTWCFSLPLLSSFDHLLADLFEGRVYWQVTLNMVMTPVGGLKVTTLMLHQCLLLVLLLANR